MKKVLSVLILILVIIVSCGGKHITEKHFEEMMVSLQKGNLSPLVGDDKETEKRNIAEIILAKNRGGSVGTVELLWMGNFTKFENLGDRDDEERF